jgi:hypothetical protein
LTSEKYQSVKEVWPADLGQGETALFDSRTQRYLTVNETGRAIWEALRDPGGVEDAARALVAQFEVDQEEATRAAAEFIPQLLAENLIQRG